MLGMPIIHFFNLPDLAAALADSPGPREVHVESLVRTEAASNVPGLRYDIGEVHARAIDQGRILTFMLYVGRVQMLHGQPFGKEGDQDELDYRLNATEKAMASYLLEKGLLVKPGLVDIGGAQTVSGSWLGLSVVWRNGEDNGETG